MDRGVGEEVDGGVVVGDYWRHNERGRHKEEGDGSVCMCGTEGWEGGWGGASDLCTVVWSCFWQVAWEPRTEKHVGMLD